MMSNAYSRSPEILRGKQLPEELRPRAAVLKIADNLLDQIIFNDGDTQPEEQSTDVADIRQRQAEIDEHLRSAA